MLGEPVKLHAVGVVGKSHKGKLQVWGNLGPQPPGTRLASHPLWMARLDDPALVAAWRRCKSVLDPDIRPMEDFWWMGVRRVLSSASVDQRLLRLHVNHMSAWLQRHPRRSQAWILLLGGGSVLETRCTSY